MGKWLVETLRPVRSGSFKMHSGNQAAPQRSVHASQTLCTFKTIYFLLDICTVGAINYIVQMSCMCDREKPQNTCISCHNLKGVRTTMGCLQVRRNRPGERLHCLCPSVPGAAQTQRGKRRLSGAQGALAIACSSPVRCWEHPPRIEAA